MPEAKTKKFGNHELKFVPFVNKTAAFSLDRAQTEIDKNGASEEVMTDALTENLISEINLITEKEIKVGEKKEKSFEKKEIPRSEWKTFFGTMDINLYVKVIGECKSLLEDKIESKKKS